MGISLLIMPPQPDVCTGTILLRMQISHGLGFQHFSIVTASPPAFVPLLLKAPALLTGWRYREAGAGPSLSRRNDSVS